MQSAAELLGPEGPFASLLPGFEARPGQQEMADQVAEALEFPGTYVIESGTGTGKTLAYLVPAVLSGKRVIVSTGTRHLQDQLFRNDFPLVRKALARPVSVALLKGRSNYLCLHRLELAPDQLNTREQAQHLERVRAWGAETRSGDIAEVDGVPENSPLWSLVTSTRDNCLGTQCDYYENCFVNQVRRSAQKAEILIINHHLFFADLLLQEEGFGQLLPGADAVIFDEAHQLPATASMFLGDSVGSAQINELCRDTRTEDVREKSAHRDLPRQLDQLEKAVADLRLSFPSSNTRLGWDQALVPAVKEALDILMTRLSAMVEILYVAAAAGPGLTRCAERANQLLTSLESIQDQSETRMVRWIELSGRSFRLHSTPLEVGSMLNQHVGQSEKSWVFTSATLTVAGNFDHFSRQMGLTEPSTAHWDSPFDFARQSLLYLPEDMPDPRQPEFIPRLVEVVLPVVQASQGRAFILFTSYRAMHQAHELLVDQLPFPIFLQGQSPKHELLEQFRASNGVLLGTASFWQGVDVRGEALSCVVIDKLPFAAPDDPVLRARLRAMEEDGQNPFREHQLPSAVIALKQGVGRLIRDRHDRGVLVICDPRLQTKSYGKVFLNSLPAMPRTQRLADVEDFFEQIPPEPESA